MSVGSAAQGDGTASSDIDLLSVTTDDEPRWLDRLAEAVLSGCAGGGRRVEYVLYAASQLATPHQPLRPLLNVNAGGGTPAVVERTSDLAAAHWFLLDVAMARSFAVPLLGPPIEQRVEEPARREVTRAITASLD